MTFGLFSLGILLAGIAALAIGLWFAQRLRVRHREVEVVTTIFWQAALEETRARVFVRRFRHWRAYALLLLIASLIWLLVGGPQTFSIDGTRHVILLDWRDHDESTRRADLETAIAVADTLPTGDREIVAVGSLMQTLLRENEPTELARRRAGETDGSPGPADIDWAIESLLARASEGEPIRVHLVGDAVVDESRWNQMVTSPENVPFEIVRVTRSSLAEPSPRLTTLGIAESADGSWDHVDLWVASNDSSADTEVKASVNGVAVEKTFTRREDGIHVLASLPTNGDVVDVTVGDLSESITLPRRSRIRVQIEPESPPLIRQLLAIDPACELVEGEADVRIGLSDDCDLQLVGDDESAFKISTDDQNAESALEDLVDRLALRQIDATRIAEQSGRVIDVQVVEGASRSIAVWDRLFTDDFDFVESRVCPILLSRSVRWLAKTPSIVSWAEVGQRLPENTPSFDRVVGSTAVSADGRSFQAVALASDVDLPMDVAAAESRPWLAGVHPVSWIGLLLLMLLVGEWVLFQRGLIP